MTPSESFIAPTYKDFHLRTNNFLAKISGSEIKLKLFGYTPKSMQKYLISSFGAVL